MRRFCFYLQADGQVDSAAERRADGARVKTQVFEELGEGVRERHPGPLLRHHHAGPDPGQIQTSSLGGRSSLSILSPSSLHDAYTKSKISQMSHIPPLLVFNPPLLVSREMSCSKAQFSLSLFPFLLCIQSPLRLKTDND